MPANCWIQKLLELAAVDQHESGPMGEQRVALALDERPILRCPPSELGADDLVHHVGQMAQRWNLPNRVWPWGQGLHPSYGRLSTYPPRPAEGGRPSGANIEKERIQIGISLAPPVNPAQVTRAPGRENGKAGDRSGESIAQKGSGVAGKLVATPGNRAMCETRTFARSSGAFDRDRDRRPASYRG